MNRLAAIRSHVEKREILPQHRSTGDWVAIEYDDDEAGERAYLLARLDEAVALLRKIDACQPDVPCTRCCGSGWPGAIKALLAEIEK